MTDNGGQTITITSIVAAETLQPFVQLDWRDGGAQLTPDEARALSRQLAEAAEAADSDAFLMEFLKERVWHGADDSLAKSAVVLEGLREYREARRG
jgi:hypothetical protein